MLTPAVCGYILPRAFIAWCFVPAFMKGFSVLPEDATMPTVARHLDDTTFFFFDGMSSVHLPPSLVVRTAKVPGDLQSLPPSPGFSSTLHILVPSGTPKSSATFPCPYSFFISCPTCIPLVARNKSFWLFDSTNASGDLLPGACIISMTVPLDTFL